MLDPYYRTLRGFQTLVEKEWVSFGHKFCQRTGGPADGGNLIFPQTSSPMNADLTPPRVEASNPEERSPIFLQFIDCVWQMMMQFPASFEFNEYFLITILDELYACRFGTFLFDSECEARNNFAREKTISLWGYINAQTRKYLNPNYTPAEVSGHRLIIPSAARLELKLWNNYYLRWQPFMRCQEPVMSRSAQVLDRMQKFRAFSRRYKRELRESSGSCVQKDIGGSVPSLALTQKANTSEAMALPAVKSAVPPRHIFPRFPTSNSAGTGTAHPLEKASMVATEP